MNSVERSLIDAVGALRGVGARSALVGGLAVSARAEPRLTRDADFAVAVGSDEDAERVVRALIAEGYALLAAVEQEAVGRLATVRLTRATDEHSTVTDLLFASSGIEPEIVDAADDIEILPGVVVRVATIGHLIATKLLARDDRSRPTDADDLRALAGRAVDVDWCEAEIAVALITARGFARGRDLEGSLAQLRTDGAY
ncbi:MAG: nucleotidyl transferase AbiEii/AbiGii toxin family protein [Acidimicrobiia bacterium]|nr:nucleotidyl transferase AbiEii/AbiGii toxin family protein [Acidimicrobiia bacterium]